jgi:hypothetical protein
MLNDPRNMTAQQWFDALALVVTDAPRATGKLLNEEDWQNYAAGFVFAQSGIGRSIPDPYEYKDWREWASRSTMMLTEGD